MLGMNESDATESVEAVMQLHADTTEVLRTCFKSHALVCKRVKEAIQILAAKNINGVSFSQILSSLCEKLLKRSGRCYHSPPSPRAHTARRDCIRAEGVCMFFFGLEMCLAGSQVCAAAQRRCA